MIISSLPLFTSNFIWSLPREALEELQERSQNRAKGFRAEPKLQLHNIPSRHTTHNTHAQLFGRLFLRFSASTERKAVFFHRNVPYASCSVKTVQVTDKNTCVVLIARSSAHPRNTRMSFHIWHQHSRVPSTHTTPLLPLKCHSSLKAPAMNKKLTVSPRPANQIPGSVYREIAFQ